MKNADLQETSSAGKSLWRRNSGLFKARLVDLDGGLESPCMRKAKLNVFFMSAPHYHSFCMDHCKKLGSRSPPLRTKTEWENLLREMKAVSPDPRRLPTKIWLSASEEMLDLVSFTTDQKEPKLRKVYGETFTLENN